MILEWARAIAGLILVLFIPGYTMTWSFYPGKGDITNEERFALSVPLSIASVTLSVLFLDMGLGLDTTPPNIVIMIVALILLSLLVWKVRFFMANMQLKRTIAGRAFEYRDKFTKLLRLRRHV